MRLLLKRPLVFSAAAALLAVVILFKIKPLVLLLCIALMVAISVLLIIRKYKRLILFLSVIAALCVSVLFTNQKIDTLHRLCGDSINAKFTVLDDSISYGNVSRVTVLSNGGIIPRGSKISLSYFTSDTLLSGERLNATVNLSGLADDQYRDYYYGNQIYVKGKISDFEKTDNVNGFFYFIGRIRRFVRVCLFNNLSYDSAALNTALTIGDKTYLQPRFDIAAQKTGVSHIMVVSGLHLAIIMGFIFNATDRFIYNRWLKAAVGIVSVIMITAICGFTLSVIRAAYMFALSAIAPIFRRESDSFNSLGLAVIVILIATPYAYLSVSFRLSLLATLAVVWLVPFYNDFLFRTLRISSGPVKWFVGTMVTSVMATLITSPVCIETFGIVSIVAPITNLLIVYPVTWALTCSIGGVFCASVGLVFIAKPLLLLSELCSKYIYAAIFYVDSFPITAVSAQRTGLYISYLLIALAVAFMCFYKYYFKRRIINADYKRGRFEARDSLKKFGARVSAVRRRFLP